MTRTGLVFANCGSLELDNARVHSSMVGGLSVPVDDGGFLRVDIKIADGKVVSIIQAAGEGKSQPNDLKGAIIFPTLIDCHTHLDKGHIWQRSPNPDGSFMGALETAGADRETRWNAEDVQRRMEFSLQSAFAHGTSAIRTHLDSLGDQPAISWPVFEKIRDDWAGRIDLQAACLFAIDAAEDDQWFNALVDRVAGAGGVLGAVTFMVPNLDELLDKMFRAAIQHNLDLDFHADETNDVDAVSLSRIAEAAIRHNYQGQILVGHCCSLARQADDQVKYTLDRCAEAGLAVVSLPLCNMYLQDRRADNTTPRWRGVTLLHEMKARGIDVCVASDNTRDPFYAYGDLDMLEVYRMATRIVHFDHPVADWPRSISSTPASVMKLDRGGQICVGDPADMIIFKGRSWTELLSRPEADRIVLRSGKTIDTTLPDYAELDDLMG